MFKKYGIYVPLSPADDLQMRDPDAYKMLVGDESLIEVDVIDHLYDMMHIEEDGLLTD